MSDGKFKIADYKRIDDDFDDEPADDWDEDKDVDPDREEPGDE